MIVKVLKNYKLVDEIKAFTRSEIGGTYFDSDSLGEAFKESSSQVPIVMILRPGTESTHRIYSLLQKAVPDSGPDMVQMVSLGQGQEKYALNCIHRGQKHGFWVVL